MQDKGGIDSKTVWVFNGAGAQFSSGVFDSMEIASEWISKNKLTGVLTRYPVNTGVYDWAVTKGFFKIKKPEQTEPKFIQRFSSASMEHYHFEGGICES